VGRLGKWSKMVLTLAWIGVDVNVESKREVGDHRACFAAQYTPNIPSSACASES
jgi:hypothetical protein